MSLTIDKLLMDQINAALDEIRPHLIVDGGNIEVVELTDDMELKVKWMGNCEFCSMSAMTMKAGVEQAIRQKLPQIKKVTAINGVV
jgi:Fe-S cluster biogenesis protein NfuA